MQKVEFLAYIKTGFYIILYYYIYYIYYILTAQISEMNQSKFVSVLPQK